MRRWVVVVGVTALLLLAFVQASLDRAGLDLVVAGAFAVGAFTSVLVPVRYRIGGSTHGLTLDEAMLLAMLLALPPAWPPLVHVVAVAAAHLARRTPPIRLAFNVGSVGTSSSLATLAYHVLADAQAPFSAASLGAFLVASVLYATLAGVLIAVLFQRLGLSTFREGIADVLPVSRVSVPANIAAGLLLGWLARSGPGLATVGVGLVVVLFVAYRTSIGARLQRDRASRMRDVATALVGASGSFAQFDQALERIADLFGADGAELLLANGNHRRVGHDVVEGPSPAARAALQLEEATAFEGGTPEGGEDGALAAPLVDDAGVLGSLVVHGRRGLEFWDDADEDVLAGVAGEVVVALHNEELLRQVAAERTRLANQSELLGGILTAASDGIALLSLDGEVLAWNPAMSEITGTGEPIVVGRPWRQLLVVDPEEEDDDPVGTAVGAAAAGMPQARTWHVRRTLGEDRWVRAQLTSSTAGDRPAVVLVLRDVTAAREVDRLKADFIATVSHELRTPLTPLKGFLELINRRQLDPVQQKEMNSSMLRQVARLENLVEDLLAMAQLDQEMVDLAHVELSLEVVLSRVQVNYAGEPRVEVETDASTIIGDADAAVRILDALVNNALKHTDGLVRVKVEHQPGRVLLHVVDEGPGIAVADQEAIFERFHRLGDHLHRTQGPGLGLPIARALARRLGGDVVVASTPGDGATFTASFRAPD